MTTQEPNRELTEEELAFGIWAALRKGDRVPKVATTFRIAERTVGRYQAADHGFEEEKEDYAIAHATGWTTKHVAHLRTWWGKAYRSPKTENKQATRRPHREGETLLIQQRTVAHAQKLKDCAEELSTQLKVPTPAAAGVWMPSTSESARAFVRSGRPKEGDLLSLMWNPSSPGQISLPVDGNDYLPLLQRHIPDQTLWSGVQEWRAEAATYFRECGRAFRKMVQETERLTGECLHADSDYPQEGILWTFAIQLYRHHAQMALFPGGRGLLDNVYVSHDSQPSRIAAQGLVYALWHGAVGIACHRERDVLKRWQETHHQLLELRPWARRARTLANRDAAIRKRAQPLQLILRREIERGMFDGGHCDHCP